MSVDVVDDLHAAEDMAGLLCSALEQLMAAEGGEPNENAEPVWVNARAAVEAWRSYCRPGCGADGVHEDCEDSDPECCGCPCIHTA